MRSRAKSAQTAFVAAKCRYIYFRECQKRDTDSPLRLDRP